ncbi:MAG TPA: hypothetical protein VEC99_04430 [Clostridia bacterium]|nr:hypothetical protein [Clostridia bacterium]
MKTLSLLMLGVTLAMPAVSRAATSKGIEGSLHDFSDASYTWNTRRGVCSPCHSAHNTDPAQTIPLWNHQTSTGPFTMYTSPTLNYTPGTAPNGPSLACLSCHDGTVGINAPMSGLGTNTAYYIDPAAKIGPDLHTTHPISFTYDAALAAADGGLENPVTYKIGDAKTGLTVNNAPVPATWSGTSLTGKTIDQALLVGHKMQCSSCHDPHKMVGSAPSSGIMIKISGSDVNGRGSLLCRTCHIK